jgi:hypothetical protein
MSRAPRREQYTICTAVAPDVVLTVRTYGDNSPPYDPELVHRFAHDEPRTRRSARRAGSGIHDREPSRVYYATCGVAQMRNLAMSA